MQAKNLCFYLSDHGFGHIARNIPLIVEAVRRTNGFVYVVCGERHLEFAKANLLEMLTPEQSSRIRYRAEHTDIGLILQHGTLLVDTAALTDACAQYLAELPERAKQEADWLRQHDVAAALCDMPLWSISACERAGVPLLYVGNFTWTELYREFLPEHIWKAYAAEYRKIRHGMLYALHNPEMLEFLPRAELSETSLVARPFHPDEIQAIRARHTCPVVFVALGMSAQFTQPVSVEGVHPTDAYAQEHENGQLGKTEMWYVLDAGREARLVYGLKQNCTKAEMRRAIADGTVMKYLQKVPIHKDDLFFIQAGTVHAIGAGALVAEIQENSNLTYRLYDYDRVGKDGKKRELHIDKALDVANLKSSAEPKQPLRVLKYRQGIASELLTRCKYFEVYRMIVNTERRQKVHYRADEIAFRVLLCVNGCGTISYEGGNLPFYKGDCIFVPADSEVLTIHGQAQFLDVRG